MTPDQAETLMRAAFDQGGLQADDIAFARKLAIALNAIGLLAFAVDPQAPVQRDTMGQGTPETHPELWASRRNRP